MVFSIFCSARRKAKQKLTLHIKPGNELWVLRSARRGLNCGRLWRITSFFFRFVKIFFLNLTNLICDWENYLKQLNKLTQQYTKSECSLHSLWHLATVAPALASGQSIVLAAWTPSRTITGLTWRRPNTRSHRLLQNPATPSNSETDAR